MREGPASQLLMSPPHKGAPRGSDFPTLPGLGAEPFCQHPYPTWTRGQVLSDRACVKVALVTAADRDGGQLEGEGCGQQEFVLRPW